MVRASELRIGDLEQAAQRRRPVPMYLSACRHSAPARGYHPQ